MGKVPKIGDIISVELLPGLESQWRVIDYSTKNRGDYKPSFFRMFATHFAVELIQQNPAFISDLGADGGRSLGCVVYVKKEPFAVNGHKTYRPG